MNLGAIHKKLKSKVKGVPTGCLVDAGLWVMVAFTVLYSVVYI